MGINPGASFFGLLAGLEDNSYGCCCCCFDMTVLMSVWGVKGGKGLRTGLAVTAKGNEFCLCLLGLVMVVSSSCGLLLCLDFFFFPTVASFRCFSFFSGAGGPDRLREIVVFVAVLGSTSTFFAFFALVFFLLNDDDCVVVMMLFVRKDSGVSA